MRKLLTTFLFLLMLGCMQILFAQSTFLPTNYDEPYRGQYHFSQQSGWMNDVNGLWYNNGIYYMTYQTTPNSLSFDFTQCSLGMATSPDMMHWTQKPVIAVPTATEGTPMSGSVVIDSLNTSGLKTGTNPVFVAIYTSGNTGQCLLYSNDLGITWVRYSGNPVINTGGTNPRDPHIAWYAPTSKWVMVLYHELNGPGTVTTDFYTSSNLINWTLTSTVANFGHECPDFFQLPVDGNQNNKKWVLWEGDSQYFIGTFNGTTFTPDAGGSYHLVNNSGIGAGFYAAQTFFKNSFPDNRVIQLAWMSGLGSGTTAPWTNNSTFPAEVKLQTFPEGVRASRTPIAEISNLYGTTQSWSSQTLSSGQNLFAGKLSKCYDIEAVFDVSNTTATAITFQFANRTVTYDVINKTLFGYSLKPINNIVKIRFLVDWGELEAFGNDGEYSYAENFEFTPSDNSVSMTANGSINLVSARYSTVNRTCPGAATPCNSYVDDVDAGNVYNGAWTPSAGEAGYYKTTCHIATAANASVQYAFSGTQVSWYGLKNVDLGMATVYIDGVLAADNIDCYSTIRIVQQLFTKTGLSSGNHTIKVVTKGTKNPASAGIALVHDYFSCIAAPTSPTAVDDASPATTYNGTWTTDVNPIYYNSTCHVSNIISSSFQATFNGTQALWFGLKNVDLGMAAVYIDGVLLADSIDCYSTTKAVNLLFSKTDLTSGNHTIKVVVKGIKNPLSSGTAIVHDYFDFPQVTPTIIDDASASTIYNGTWSTDANAIYYDNTCHVGVTVNSYCQVTFTGTQISWYGLKNSDLGMATVYVDGVLAQDNIDCYSSSPRAVYLLFNKTGLSNGNHTIKVVVKGTKNAASAGIALVHDYFSISNVTSPAVSITGDLSFGNVKQNSTAIKTVTISNTGSTVFSVDSIDLPDGFAADWTSGDIAAAGHQDVKITFAPILQNVYSGTLTINTSTGIFSMPVSGTGINAYTMNTILPDNPDILYMGRIDFSNPVKPLFAYPNVTIRAKFEGTSINLLLKDYNGSDFTDNYFQSIVDGGTPVKFIVTSGQQTYPVAKNLTDGTHTVEIVKVTETYNGECQFLGFQTDTLKSLVTPDPLPDLKLEFFGNSITSGYGIEGGTQPAADNSYKAYPAVAARALNAQFHTTSYSGIGVVKGFPAFLMGQMYNRTIANTTYSVLPPNNTWDFTQYIPDYVVVALGTNDYNLGFGAGTITTASFDAGYNSLVSKIRLAYPNAQIICTNSPMISDSKLGSTISGNVTTFNTAGDSKIHYFAFTLMQGGGAGGHPGVADGQTNGLELAAYIRSLMNSTAVSEIDKSNTDITIFPNPAKSNITIINLSPGSLISVIGLDAKTISTQKVNNSTVNYNVSSWNKGIYFFNFKDRNSVTVRKVVIN